MEITLVEPRGFCSGVNRAIQMLEKVLVQESAPVYVYHEIVHNTWVVNYFRQHGVVFVQTLDEVPENSVLLFSAHGVSPAVRKEAEMRHLRTVDATCPLVARIHQQVKKLTADGFSIIFIGHRNHDEVVGILGESPVAITLISSADEVDSIYFPESTPLTYLMQTTLSVSEAATIVQKLKTRFPQLVKPRADGICFATQQRQEAVRRLMADHDILLVVGSQNSSNSRRLAEIARDFNKKSYLIDGAEDMCPDWFQKNDRVLLTAGASAPEAVFQQCVGLLEKWEKEQNFC